MKRITRKFWFNGEERWFAYYYGTEFVAFVRDELDIREIAA